MNDFLGKRILFDLTLNKLITLHLGTGGVRVFLLGKKFPVALFVHIPLMPDAEYNNKNYYEKGGRSQHHQQGPILVFVPDHIHPLVPARIEVDKNGHNQHGCQGQPERQLPEHFFTPQPVGFPVPDKLLFLVRKHNSAKIEIRAIQPLATPI